VPFRVTGIKATQRRFVEVRRAHDARASRNIPASRVAKRHRTGKMRILSDFASLQ